MSADTSSLVRRAEALIELGRPHMAIPVLQEALGIDPGDPYVLCWLARAQEPAGYLREALETAEQAVAADPEYAWGHHLRGWMLYRSGQLVAAVEATRVAVTLDPWNLYSRCDLAWFLSLIGAGKESRRVARQVVRDHPDQAYAWNSLCLSNWALGQLGRAEQEARKALALAPSEATFHNNVGWALALQREFERAVPFFRRAVELTPWSYSDLTTFNLEFCLRAIGEGAEAAEIHTANARAGLASVDVELGARPNSSELLTYRGFWLRQLHRDEEALSEFTRARSMAQSPADEIIATRHLFSQEVILEQDDLAVEHAREVLQHPANDWMVCSDIACIGWLVSEPSLVSGAAERAAQLVDVPGLADDAMAWAALADENWLLARELLEARIRRRATAMTCCEHVGLALAQYRLGHESAARESFAIGSWMYPRCTPAERFRSLLGG